jgi:hypothetical protein
MGTTIEGARCVDERDVRQGLRDVAEKSGWVPSE